jgi:hypothetical protein
LIGAFLLLLPVTTVQAEPRPGDRYAFGIWRNGERIGSHTVNLRGEPDRLAAEIAVELKVKLLGITVFRYTHRAEERWEGDRLAALTAETYDNGERYRIQAQAGAQGLLVNAEAAPPEGATPANFSQRVFDPTLLPTSHWNPHQVTQHRLLNTQTGEADEVKIERVGRDVVQTPAGPVQATRYRYSGDLRMEQWYSDDGRWLGLAFSGRDGSRVEYRVE